MFQSSSIWHCFWIVRRNSLALDPSALQWTSIPCVDYNDYSRRCATSILGTNWIGYWQTPRLLNCPPRLMRLSLFHGWIHFCCNSWPARHPWSLGRRPGNWLSGVDNSCSSICRAGEWKGFMIRINRIAIIEGDLWKLDFDHRRRFQINKIAIKVWLIKGGQLLSKCCFNLRMRLN